MSRKLMCLKCGNDQFKVSLTEREIITEIIPGRSKVNIVEMIHITCTECGWGKHLHENPAAPHDSAPWKSLVKESDLRA